MVSDFKFLNFGRVFNKTIIVLELRASMAVYHVTSNARSLIIVHLSKSSQE